jgi:hypothetical protein
LDVMIAALGTLPFVATLWLLVVLGARVLEESGAKIAAALKGETACSLPSRQVMVRLRARPRVQQVRRAEPQLRAAA